MTSYIAGLIRSVSKCEPRAYCGDCRWEITRRRGLSPARVGNAAREHARDKGHEVRTLITYVTFYKPDGAS